MGKQSLTETTARLICGFAGTVIPEIAFYRSKIAVLDCVGVALAGSREPVGRIMLDYARSLPGGGEATIWGTAYKVAAVEAAMVRPTSG